MMGWVDTIPMTLARVVGIAPGLAVVAALCLAVLHVLPAGLHLSRGEVKEIAC
ncbi:MULTISPECIES: hypothetical protein [Mumia]|uniref:hypothetical protein n=1 Tax=Mumia TaxID=1546255 RepID=UPI001AB03CDC|nr:hypothetical protein [Mumia sp. ZJ430]